MIGLSEGGPFPVDPNFGESKEEDESKEDGRGDGVDEAVREGAIHPSHRRRSAIRAEVRHQIRQ